PDDITLPPPEIRSVIEKTAGYVSRNGDSFEQRIKLKEASNSKFQFLNKDDPYNAYYTWYLKEILDGNVKSNTNTASVVSLQQATSTEMNNNNNNGDSVPVPKPFQYLQDGDLKLSNLDHSMIKLAAQLIAVNGTSYAAKLSQHIKSTETLKVQFAFLEPSHSLHPIYQDYLSQYNYMLKHKDELLERVAKSTTSLSPNEFKSFQFEFLDRCFNRAEFIQQQQQDKSSQLAQAEKERLEFASIDWKDFRVVETVVFEEIDEVAELDPPLNLAELEYRSLLSKSGVPMENVGLLEEAEPDYEPDQESDDDTNENVPTNTTGLVAPKGMKIRAAGETRLKRNISEVSGDNGSKEKLLKCPITGQMIPESKFDRHLSIVLRDPRYKQEKANYEAKMKFVDSSLNDGTEIFENIKRLAESESSIED
ncbi:hypothetical protein CANARDRAFT_191151, partial [[Candida] arabinofermentans NRRL YB-2248]